MVDEKAVRVLLIHWFKRICLELLTKNTHEHDREDEVGAELQPAGQGLEPLGLLGLPHRPCQEPNTRQNDENQRGEDIEDLAIEGIALSSRGGQQLTVVLCKIA